MEICINKYLCKHLNEDICNIIGKYTEYIIIRSASYYHKLTNNNKIYYQITTGLYIYIKLLI